MTTTPAASGVEYSSRSAPGWCGFVAEVSFVHEASGWSPAVVNELAMSA